jgi:putative acetyltransferase
MESTLIIRPLEPDDNPAIARIIIETLAEFGFSGPGTAGSDLETASLFEYYQQSNAGYWVAEEEQVLLGGMGFSRLKGTSIEESVCELEKGYLLPHARGKGIGKRLLQQCMTAARDMGYRYMYAETTAELESRVLLERWGFYPVAEKMGNNGHHLVTLFYLCDLV